MRPNKLSVTIMSFNFCQFIKRFCMKKLTIMLTISVGCCFSSGLAGEAPSSSQDKGAPHVIKTPQPLIKPQVYHSPAKQQIRVTIKPGSLHDNIVRIAKQNNWDQIVWKAPDYNWAGKTTITAPRLQDIMKQLLNDYPLQAVFYEGNHVLLITPRTLSGDVS